MKRIYIFFLVFVLLSLSNSISAQSWRSALYPDTWESASDKDFYRDKVLQDYSYAGYHRGEREIPTVQENIIDITKGKYKADNTGAVDVTNTIQTAIDDLVKKGGGVVYLPVGTYMVSPQVDNDFCLKISDSNIVLRGDGPGKTFLYNSSSRMRSNSIIAVAKGGSWSQRGANMALITSNQMQPTKIIPVVSVTGYRKGDLVIVRNDITEDWITEHKMDEFWSGYGKKLNGLIYCREIVDVDSLKNELILDIPIRYALKTEHNARVYKAPSLISEVGIEHLSIGNRQSFIAEGWEEEDYNTLGNGSYDCHDSYAIIMKMAVNCWIRGVASYQPLGNTSGTHILSNGILITDSKNVSVKDCVFESPQYGGGGGNGYMIRVSANESLIQNCVAEFNRHGFVLSHMKSSGNVFQGCSDILSGRQRGITGNEKTIGSGSDHHMHFSHSNLYDECKVSDSYLDAHFRPWGGNPMHGVSAAHSVYWNITGEGNQDFSVRSQQARYGYIIGTKGENSVISTTSSFPETEFITNPVDHVEGVGESKNLIPQSLYEDQLQKRLQILELKEIE